MIQVVCIKFMDDYQKWIYLIYIYFKLYAASKLSHFEDSSSWVIIIKIHFTSHRDIHIIKIYYSLGMLQFNSQEQNLNVVASLEIRLIGMTDCCTVLRKSFEILQ
jgi:hypothetical protein